MKIKLFVDTEGDFYRYIPSPHFSKIDFIKWKINGAVGKLFRYPKSGKGLKNIVAVLKKYKFPATFCISGHLYLKDCKGFQHFLEIKPENKWYKKMIGEDWYYWDKKNKNGLCFGNFIEKEMKGVKYFKFGLHGFSHEALTLERKEVVDSVVKSGIEAAKQIGIKIESFAAPFNMIEDVKDKNKIFDILKKYKIKECQYAGYEDNFESFHREDFKTIEENGIKKYAVKESLDGTDSYKKIRNTIKRLKKCKEEKVLMIHDFTWRKKKFEFLIKEIINS